MSQRSPSILDSFNNAFEGIIHVLRTQRNMRIHFLAAVVVLVAGVWVGVSKLELIAGFNISGTIKAVIAGMFLMVIGSLIAGIPNPLDPLRLIRLFVVVVLTSFALISLMFLLMVRVTDPLLPRAMFGVLNTVLYFPSGAVYPQQGFPGWMQVIAVADRRVSGRWFGGLFSNPDARVREQGSACG
jgi:ABC-type multidrug transport system permease subunit